jgi:hypothetical protein
MLTFQFLSCRKKDYIKKYSCSCLGHEVRAIDFVVCGFRPCSLRLISFPRFVVVGMLASVAATGLTFCVDPLCRLLVILPVCLLE